MRDDFRLLLQKVFRQTSMSIDLIIYALTDTSLIHKLYQKARQGIAVRVTCDPSSGSPPLRPPIITYLKKSKGLMHQKIIISDETSIFLGSANLTTSSLLFHDNLLVGIYCPSLAEFIKLPHTAFFDFTLEKQPCRCWLLPDPEALSYLQDQLKKARCSIFIAMFTFTHPELIAALIEAHQRGVQVTVAIDRYTARGASRKAIQLLRAHRVPLIYSQGITLLHHKWAYIDRSTLILGSTNWTKAAFTKNRDLLLFVTELATKHQLFFDRLCHTIALESKETL